MKNRGKCALVTGGAGFIGSHFVDRLLSEGYRVRIIDNFSSGRLENIPHRRGNPNVEVVVGDLKNKEDSLKTTKDVNVVFHYAANPEVRVSTTNPEIHFSENVVATFNLLEAIRKNDVEEMVFASSSSVYGEPKIPVPEDAPIRPMSVYGASKASCDALIHAYSSLYCIKAVVLRYANIIGPRLRHAVVYDFMIKLLKNSKELEILGDGTQVRSYMYIDDAVEATLVAWKASKVNCEVFNVGSEDWITVKEVADVVTKTLNLDNVKYVYKPVLRGVGWPGDVKRIALAIDKIRNYGFRPSLTSKEAVRKTVSALKNELQVQGYRHDAS